MPDHFNRAHQESTPALADRVTRAPATRSSLGLQLSAGNQAFARFVGDGADASAYAQPRPAQSTRDSGDPLVERALARAVARRSTSTSGGSAIRSLQASTGAVVMAALLQRAPDEAATNAHFNVVVVELGMNRLTEVTRDAARSTTDKELDRVAASSKDKKVKHGFNVERRRSISKSEAKAFGKSDFVLYLIPSRDASMALERAKMHLDFPPEHEAKVLAQIKRQLDVEGGAHVKFGRKGVSFVATDLFESALSHVPGETDDERAHLEQRVGQQMAELMLHELGHAMGAGHDKTIMAESVEMNFGEDSAPERFTDKSRKQIVKNLESR